jgi:chloride channel protein, CIC family
MKTGDAPFGRLIAFAVVVGVLGAATAIAVRGALSEGLALLYHASDVVSGIRAMPAWVRILAPAAGGVVAGTIVALVLRRGSPGVADVMEAVALGRGRPRFRAAVAQAAASVAASLGGGSIGREGPLIQLGAGVGHGVARRATESNRARRALVAAGTSAGFAAAYNTPIAAVLFVLEVVVGTLTVEVLIPVLVATAVGTALTRAVIGGGPIYGARAFVLISPAEFIAFGAIGVLCAFGGVGFMKLLGLGERSFQRLRVARPVRAGIGGLLVGLVVWRLPEVAGNGYEPLREILDGRFALGALLLLAVAKAFASTASVSSGSPGGVFTPNMLVGASIGAACGELVTWIAPHAGVLPGGYALVGMAAAVAATTHAPLMATALAFELSGDYEIVLPLLLATAIATLLARRLQHDSIYTAELRRRGIWWEGSLAERLARAARARDLMEPDPPIVPASEPLASALARLADIRGRLLYVVDDGPLRAISLTAAKRYWSAAVRGEPLAPITAGDAAGPVKTVRPDDSLLEIGEKLWIVDWGELPIVDPAAPSRPIGTVTRRALLGAFDRELLQRDVLTTRVFAPGDGVDYLELPDGHRVAIVPAPARMLDQPLDVGRLRAELGVIVIGIRRDAGDLAPRWLDPDAVRELERGDHVMVIATEAELASLQAR